MTAFVYNCVYKIFIFGKLLKMQNTLFYSKYCPHSNKLSQYLDKHPDMKQMFLPICVDARVKIPSFVKSVPTIVIYDESGKMNWYSGEQVFAWFKTLIQSQTENKPEGDGIEDYDSMMMGNQLGGFGGSSFTFVDDESKNSNIMGDYAWLNDDSAIKIQVTMDAEAESKRMGKPMKTSESALQRYKDERDRGIPQPPGLKSTQVPDFTNDALFGNNGGGSVNSGITQSQSLMYNPNPNAPVRASSAPPPQRQPPNRQPPNRQPPQRYHQPLQRQQPPQRQQFGRFVR